MKRTKLYWKKKPEDVYKFSEHAVIQALDSNEQLRFWTFSIELYVVSFDTRANLIRT